MSENNKTDFITYPKTFEKYRWYKPILVFIISAIIYVILSLILTAVFGTIYGESLTNSIVFGGYESMNNPIGQIFTDLSVIIMIPSLYIGAKIVRDRPFSSYVSTRGGWNYKLYLKAFIIPFILTVIYSAMEIAILGKDPNAAYHFSALLLIATIILVPLQCIAEEYVFRGLFMQTFGAWFRIPLAAIILQSIAFTVIHGYNSIGLIAIFVSGIIYGFFAWKTNGIEVSSAMHTANNLNNALFTMFGLAAVTSTIKSGDVVFSITFNILLCIIMYYVGRKTDWFGELPENS